MRYLVVSDIHGSRSGAALVPELFHELHADAILCLGDVLYHGPRNNLPEDYAPKEVISILNPLAPHIFAVRGNCDAEVDQMVLNFLLTADYNEFLSMVRIICRSLFREIFSSMVIRIFRWQQSRKKYCC